MFWPIKKKQKMSQMEELQNLAIADLEDKWISFTNSPRFKNGASLSENIDEFAQPLVSFFKKRYMTLYQFSGSIFLYSVENAIINSNTHAKGEVLMAFRELEAKQG